MPSRSAGLWNLYRFHWCHRYQRHASVEDLRSYHERMCDSFHAKVGSMTRAERNAFRADLQRAKSASLWNSFMRLWYESNQRREGEDGSAFRERARLAFDRATHLMTIRERCEYRDMLAAWSVRL
ncbi:hypothetical protein AURDEDRAFT_166102 [Auricularia subglabra TFB-10046 SS5]|nr:hypothetical protein AURDEDRAFT_166102 [Auricularia subglabra TFB-10046 SS5]